MRKLTSLQKGRKLQDDFGSFLVNELGYKVDDDEDYEVPMHGETSKNKWDCDIHGVMESNDFIEYRNKAIASMVTFFLILLASNLPELQPILYSNFEGLAFFEILLIACLGSTAFFGTKAYDSKKSEIHVWVECKELVENVKRDHMVKLIEAVNDVRAFEHNDWHPDIVMFASKTGYDIDAKIYANKNGIVLYQRDGDSFKKIN